MALVNWRAAERRLQHLSQTVALYDVYWAFNIIAPLRNRYFSGERSLRLYKEIMGTRFPTEMRPAANDNLSE
jgi:hypothetical protein